MGLMGKKKGEAVPTEEIDPNKPQISKAWEYWFEQTLPRYKKDDTGNWQRAAPGEGELYPACCAPLDAFRDFGIGLALYLSTRLSLGVVFMVLGFINIYTMRYFASPAYNPTPELLKWNEIGSAACLKRPKICLNFECTETHHRNDCPLQFHQGILDMFTCACLFLFLFIITYVQLRLAEDMDVAEQTAQDYSILVDDPEGEDDDPEEWRHFFGQYGKVSIVTIAVANGELMLALAKKRNIKFQIVMEQAGDKSGMDHFMGKALSSVPKKAEKEEDEKAEGGEPAKDAEPELDKDGNPKKPKKSLKAKLIKGLDHWEAQLDKVEAIIEEKAQLVPFVVKVFVTFETETAQRRCLNDLTIGTIPALLNKSARITPDKQFRFTNVLAVTEAPEPSEILYAGMHVPMVKRVRSFIRGCVLAIALLFIASDLTELVAQASQTGAAIMISVWNAALPVAMKQLTNAESHISAGSKQNSLLIKLVLVRWINTGIMIYVACPFHKMLSQQQVAMIAKILFADASTKPLFQAIDIGGCLKRYIFAKTAKTQDRMNSYFLGTEYDLAERYTDMTKTMFVCLFFMPVFPQGLFYCSFACFLALMSDMYCLARVWRQGPMLDDALTKKSRTHIALALWVHVVMSLHYYASWPFDHICPTEDEVDHGSALKAGVTDFTRYYHCKISQQHNGFIGDVVVMPWMSEPQARLVRYYTIIAVFLTVVLAVTNLLRDSVLFFRSLCYGSYTARGKATDIPFSSVDDIQAYIPQIYIKEIAKPLLTCVVEGEEIKRFLFKGWENYYLWEDLTVKTISAKMKVKYFSRVNFWEDSTEMTYREFLERKKPDVWKTVKDAANREVDPNASEFSIVKGALTNKEDQAKLK
jgi:hypothetical protein